MNIIGKIGSQKFKLVLQEGVHYLKGPLAHITAELAIELKRVCKVFYLHCGNRVVKIKVGLSI